MTAVDSLHQEFVALVAFLDSANEISYRSVADENFRKALLLAAASYFEHRLSQEILNFVEEETSQEHVVGWLVKKKAVERQYHTWFDWRATTANQFFGLFGEAFSQSARTIVRERPDLKKSIEAFLEIGRDRNRLVHQDFGTFSLEKTAEEIYDTYRSAMEFVDWFPQELRAFCAATVPSLGSADSS